MCQVFDFEQYLSNTKAILFFVYSVDKSSTDKISFFFVTIKVLMWTNQGVQIFLNCQRASSQLTWGQGRNQLSLARNLLFIFTQLSSAIIFPNLEKPCWKHFIQKLQTVLMQHACNWSRHKISTSKLYVLQPDLPSFKPRWSWQQVDKKLA